MNDWRDRAECAKHENPDLWFSTTVEDMAEALSICAGCPTLAECRTEAAKFEGGLTWNGLERVPLSGIWAGQLPEQRTGKKPSGISTRRTIRMITCQGCNKYLPHSARGYCTACYRKWQRGTLGRDTRQSQAQNYVEWLALERQGYSRAEAARILGISRSAMDKAIQRGRDRERESAA